MLAFLEALCTALVAQDVAAVRRLLDHPLAAALPDAVLAEIDRVLTGPPGVHVMPIAALQLCHQTAHCLGIARDRGPARAPAAEQATQQMELPLAPARAAGARRTPSVR